VTSRSITSIPKFVRIDKVVHKFSQRQAYRQTVDLINVLCFA
jgi:hypothetical protein